MQTATTSSSIRTESPSSRPLVDRMSRELVRAGDRIVIALAKSAVEFVRREAWMPFGYARLGDYSREELDRSGRWLRDLAALGAGFRALPELEGAVSGARGRPIGRVAAICIARIAAPESLQAWVDRARTCSAREFQALVRAARQAGSRWPVQTLATHTVPGTVDGAASEAANENRHEVEEEFDSDSTYEVRLAVPSPVAVAFRETLELHRAVSGHQASVVSFAEALCAEAASGPAPNVEGAEWVAVKVRRAVQAEHRREATLERGAKLEAQEMRDLPRTPVTDRVRAVLEQVAGLGREAGSGEVPDLARQLRELVALEDEIERCLGQLLHEMQVHREWARLGCASLGHYAAQLGMSRRTAERRAGIVQALKKRPRVLEAYERGEIGLHAAWIVRRVLGSGAVPGDVEEAWVARARAVTIKRLRDEARALELRAHGLLPGVAAARRPLSDAAWQASLRRDPGMTRERVRHLGRLALAGTSGNVFLRLRLPQDVASDLLVSLESARQGLVGSGMEAGSPRRDVPGWMGLFALLEGYCQTWDDPRAFPVREWDAIYRRDGWRCMTPGCTGRRRIEDHHLVYRSDQGSDAEENQVSLCRLHHHLGEHGLLARCRGTAPLGILWRLGTEALGTWFRNERRLRRGQSVVA